MQSGTKLVVLLMCLAVALGVYSWWNRYESAHRITHFWGPDAAQLLIDSEEVEALFLKFVPKGSESPELEQFTSLPGYGIVSRTDLAAARGVVHLRHALTTDSNYRWNENLASSGIWQWALRFGERDREVWTFFTSDFATLGKFDENGSTLMVISCQPMAATLQDYFAKLGIAMDEDSTESADATASSATATNASTNHAAE